MEEPALAKTMKAVIETLSYEELLHLEQHLQLGNITSMVSARRELLETTRQKICPSCGGNVLEEKCYTLIFGQGYFRKKANFCGNDCLSEFLESTRKEQ
ncbi:MAG: hypothetical protein H6502_03970 [Candidatus Woesearchaeota archaeon]|nr:MAG: hypothetical protein H6502_03970 [Candidatus Woesearchaeota archaeon]